MEEFREALQSWAEENLREFPWREDVTPYQVLVAEVLLQQTLASKVEPVYEEFVDRYPEPEDLLDVDPDELAELLDPLGLQNVRAKALVDNAEEIAGWGVPRDVEELQDLSYVGRYGANATLCFGFGERRPIVDANVVRLYGRFFGTDFDGAQDDAAWEFAEEVLPAEDVQQYNLALLDFAADTCTARSPACDRCAFQDACQFYAQEGEER